MPTEPGRFVTDILVNKNYLNQPIYRTNIYAKGEVPDSSLPKRNTPAWAAWSAALMNDMTGGTEVSKGIVDINPETLIYAVHKSLGGVGKFAERTYSFGETLVLNNTGEPSSEARKAMSKYDVSSKKEIDARQIPIVRKFWGESSEMYYANEYYKIEDKVYTDFNVMELDMDNKNITRYSQMSSEDATKHKKLKETLNVLKKVDKKLKELRGKEEGIYSLDNKTDVQVWSNVIKEKKIDLYKKVYKVHNKKN
jgi:hypothetical protein